MRCVLPAACSPESMHDCMTKPECTVVGGVWHESTDEGPAFCVDGEPGAETRYTIRVISLLLTSTVIRCAWRQVALPTPGTSARVSLRARRPRAYGMPNRSTASHQHTRSSESTLNDILRCSLSRVRNSQNNTSKRRRRGRVLFISQTSQTLPSGRWRPRFHETDNHASRSTLQLCTTYFYGCTYTSTLVVSVRVVLYAHSPT